MATQPKPSVKCMLHGHKGAVNDFDWSLTNDQIVSGSADTTVHVWSADTGQSIRVFHDTFSSAGSSMHNGIDIQ